MFTDPAQNATPRQKYEAFEWLRRISLKNVHDETQTSDSFYAAVLMHEATRADIAYEDAMKIAEAEQEQRMLEAASAPHRMPLPHPGERYVGGIIQSDGRICHTFLLPGDELVPDWDAGMRLAKEKGGDLPSRIEQAMMFSFMPEEFQKEAYWSNAQHAGYSDYAWYQDFSYGLQDDNSKDYELRVRAVRRVFSDSVTQ